MLKNLFGSSSPSAKPAAAPQGAQEFRYPLKLNLGSGYKRIDGHLNVDSFAGANPDVVWDLEQTPWPFPDNVATHIVMTSVLEHLGRDSQTFLAIIRELWRICAPGARIEITVPHPRHDHFLGDPTHVRPILPATLQAFDQVTNREWVATGNAATPLGLQLGVDFHLDSINFVLDEEWLPKFVAGEVTSEQVIAASRREANVIAEFQFMWVAQKPARG